MSAALDNILRSTPKIIPRIAVPQRVRVSQGIAIRLLEKKVNPKYPEDARQAGVQGTVVLRILVSKAGEVSKIELISGDQMLAPAAIEAVRQWKYKPYLLNGNPVEVDTTVQVNFTLSPG
jgi:periplasmic protein TonB